MTATVVPMPELPAVDNSALAKLIQWWGETQAVLVELAVMARRIAKHACIEGGPLEGQIIPSELMTFALGLEDLATELSSNPPMPGRELYDPLAGEPDPDPEKLSAMNFLDLAGKDVAKWTAKDHALWDRKYALNRSKHAPSVAAAQSDSLKTLFASAMRFMQEFYPNAKGGHVWISTGDSHVALPIPLPEEGGAA